MARMGLRPGEAYALTVDKFAFATDLPKRKPPTLMIDTSLSGFTKTGEPGRPSPAAGRRRDVDRAHHDVRERRGPKRPHVHDRTWPADSDELSADAWRRRHFAPAVERAGLGDFTPNMLRHSAASFAIHNGANVYHVQRMLGHARPSITLDVYGELWDSSQEELARGSRRGDQEVGSEVEHAVYRVGNLAAVDPLIATAAVADSVIEANGMLLHADDAGPSRSPDTFSSGVEFAVFIVELVSALQDSTRAARIDQPDSSSSR